MKDASTESLTLTKVDGYVDHNSEYYIGETCPYCHNNSIYQSLHENSTVAKSSPARKHNHFCGSCDKRFETMHERIVSHYRYFTSV